MPAAVTLEELTRTTMVRQLLDVRSDASPAQVIGAVGGLQAQHGDMPYRALWARRSGPTADLADALTGRRVVRATLQRSTLHLVPAEQWAALDVVSAAERLSTWGPSARRAGVDLVELNAEVRELCRDTPRTAAEIEAFAAQRHPDVDAASAIPAGVSRPWWRLASAGGGLVQVPPAGLPGHHEAAGYVEGSGWCGTTAAAPDLDSARAVAVAGYLQAFGPASVADIGYGLGIRRVGPVKAALAEVGATRHVGPDDAELFDVPDGDVVPADHDLPVRFLPRWEHLLVAFKDRRRLLDATGRTAVYRRNGDVLPTFWVDGRVAGTWTTADDGGISLTPCTSLTAAQRDEVEAEAALLARELDADAEPRITWEDRRARGSG